MTTDTTTHSNAAALLRLERRLFGTGGADVPRLFLQVIRRYVSATAATVATTHAAPSRHSVCWLDGTLFGALSCAEYDDASEPIVRGAVVPIRELRLGTVSVHDVEHDPVTGEVNRWKRSTVFELGRGKELTFTSTDDATLDTDQTGRFVDAIMLAMRQQ